MNYLQEINAFERWLETNYLPAVSQLLWYKFIALFNRCGWAEWVTVDNRRLMAVTGIDSEKTLIRARDLLLEKGLIEYQKGKKGSPNKYRIVPVNKIHCNFYSENDSENDSENGSISAVKTTVKTAVINKHKHKLNNNKPLTPLTEDLSNCDFDPKLSEAVQDWLAYKREAKKPYKPQGLKAFLNKTKAYADKYGSEAVVREINNSMANNWQGVVWERIGGTPPKNYGNNSSAKSLDGLKYAQREQSEEELNAVIKDISKLT